MKYMLPDDERAYLRGLAKRRAVEIARREIARFYD